MDSTMKIASTVGVVGARLEGMANQTPNQEASGLSSWDVYRQAHKAIWLGTVEATDERDAIEKVANERNIPANRLIATQRR
jgi:Ser/Thr protein kinase RdoA (MazF antagonist)